VFRNLSFLGSAAIVACVLIGWPGTGTAGADAACDGIGGATGPDQICHVHDAGEHYTLDISYPVGYPDQPALVEYLAQDRDGFMNWFAKFGQPWRKRPYVHIVAGTTYRSGAPAAGTQTLVLEVSDDTGAAHEAHPNTWYKAFNFDIGKGVPITFETLFKPGTEPLQVLNPIVLSQLSKPGWKLNDLNAETYQNFALTDDAVIFFFGENQVVRDNNGPHQVSVPRADLASLLA
jgi:Protein of unknown function (DUF3298)